MSNKLNVMSSVARLDAVHTNRVAIRRVASLTPVEIVHGERRVAGYLIEALSVCDSLLDSILIVEDLVASDYGLHSARQTQTSKTVVENLVEF